MPNLKPDHIDPTDEEDARIEANIAEDPDDPAHWGTPYLPASEVLPGLVQAYQEGRLMPPSPGRLLTVTLEGAGMSQRQLAKAMNRPPNTISEIIQGRKSITAKTAIELEEVLGTPARTWLHAEADYRLALERERRKADRGV